MKKSFTLLLFFLSIISISSAQQVMNDSIRIAVEPEYNNVSKTHRFWLGENYGAYGLHL